ncbi:MAG: hypothetical protein DRO14_03105 [Thermoprotei archaeon]|nr:MAG: hypothetical protein DRO14_03105 [Thermoprotei archaeon]
MGKASRILEVIEVLLETKGKAAELARELTPVEKELLLSSIEHGVISVRVSRMSREVKDALDSLVKKGLIKGLSGISGSGIVRYALTGVGQRVVACLSSV